MDEVLTRVRECAEAVRDAQAEVVARVIEARAVGTSWAEIGRNLGISRQAAHERFKEACGG